MKEQSADRLVGALNGAFVVAFWKATEIPGYVAAVMIALALVNYSLGYAIPEFYRKKHHTPGAGDSNEEQER